MSARFPGPTRRDWLLLALGLGLTLMGVVVLPSKPDVAIVTVTMFGLASVTFLITVLRKLRAARERPVSATVVGGTLIRPSRLRVALLGGGLLAFGIVVVVFGGTYPVLFVAIGWFVLLVGAVVLGGLAIGWLPVGGLRFDPEGMTIFRKGWSVTIPWNNVRGLAASEFHSNPLLLINLRDVHAVEVHPTEAMTRYVREVGNSRGVFGADVGIGTGGYELDLPLLLTALQRYVTDPKSREELVPPPSKRLPP